MNTDAYYLSCAKVVTEQQILSNHSVLIKDGIIAEITAKPNQPYRNIELDNCLLSPGLIDLHVHGREGCDVMDAQISSIETMSRSLAKYGVTGFLPTTVTANWPDTLKAFEIIGQAYQSTMPGAQVLGAYNEGLFFTETHKGAHNENFFLPITRERVDAIVQASKGALKVMALAPELQDSTAIINYLTQLNIKVMLGHTNASYEQASEALAAGACGGVHIFNGMSGIHHRQPGCAGALLTCDKAYVEVIADGVHLHPAIMDLVYRVKGADKMALISDCISAGGVADGTYKLGELEVTVEGGIARTASGSLAGSTLTLNRSVANIVDMIDAPLVEAIRMASLTPAKLLSLDHQIGSIEVGKKACLTLFSNEFDVDATIVDGKLVYARQGSEISGYSLD